MSLPVVAERALCLSEDLEGHSVLTLNRPAARNALNVPLLRAFVDALLAAQRRDSSVVLVRAAGPAFCAGADVRADDGTLLGRPGLRRQLIEQSLDLIASFPSSVVTVHGAAVGAGWAIANAADITLASPAASFCFPELPLGFLPPASTVRRLRAVVGPARAFRLLALGERHSADDLAELGLLELRPEEALDSDARDLAARLAALPASLLRELKTTIST